MYIINDKINLTDFQGLNASKIHELNAKEMLHISLEKNSVFPKHTSPTDALLVLLEGKIKFHINASEYQIVQHQLFDFPKNEEHWVEAQENSKFLIIR